MATIYGEIVHVKPAFLPSVVPGRKLRRRRRGGSLPFFIGPISTSNLGGTLGVGFWFPPRLGGSVSVGLTGTHLGGTSFSLSPDVYRGDGAATLYIRL